MSTGLTETHENVEAYINGLKIGILYAVTWTQVDEMIYDCFGGSERVGKSVVIGSFTMSNYDRHPILEALFKLSDISLPTSKELWDTSSKPEMLTKENPFRNLSPEEFNRELEKQLKETAKIVGTVKLSQEPLPPFDLELRADGKKCIISGVQITQETCGFPNFGDAPGCGMSFAAATVSEWVPL